MTLLGTCSPLPSLIDQIKTLGELRVVTRNSPLAFYRGADGQPQGPEYELARRFADDLGVRLKMTTVSSYAEIYAALELRAGARGGGRTEGPGAAGRRGGIWSRLISACASI